MSRAGFHQGMILVAESTYLPQRTTLSAVCVEGHPCPRRAFIREQFLHG